MSDENYRNQINELSASFKEIADRFKQIKKEIARIKKSQAQLVPDSKDSKLTDELIAWESVYKDVVMEYKQTQEKFSSLLGLS